MQAMRSSLSAGARFLFVMGLSIFMGWHQTPLLNAKGYDREVYRYLGLVVLKGGIPYRDAIDIHPPIIMYLSALGEAFGIWGHWIVWTFIAGIAAWIFFERVRQYSLAGAIGATFCFFWLLNTTSLAEGGGLTRHLTASFSLILVTFAWARSGGPRQDCILGGLAALILWTQQNEAVATAPFLLVALYKSPEKGKSFLRMAFSGILVTILALSPVIFSGSLGEFWRQAFLYNARHHITWGDQRNLKTLVRLILDNLRHFNVFHAMWAMSLGAILLWWDRIRQTPLIPAAILGLAIECWAISLSGRYFGHYFMGLVPYLSVLAFFIVSKSWELRKSTLHGAFVMGVLYFAAAQIGPFDPMVHKVKQFLKTPLSHSEYFDSIPNLDAYFSEIRGQKGQLQVLFNSDFFAFHDNYQIIAPTKWFNSDFIGGPELEQIFGGTFEKVIAGMEEYKTRYILECMSERNTPGGNVKGLLTKYFADHYELVNSDKDGTWRLWKRRVSL